MYDNEFRIIILLFGFLILLSFVDLNLSTSQYRLCDLVGPNIVCVDGMIWCPVFRLPKGAVVPQLKGCGLICGR